LLHAQEFQASVSVNTDLIPVEQRIDLGTMRQDVETYVNNQRYTNMDWEGPKIPVDIGITVTSQIRQSLFRIFNRFFLSHCGQKNKYPLGGLSNIGQRVVI
jgi:hypothetical protein